MSSSLRGVEVAFGRFRGERVVVRNGTERRAVDAAAVVDRDEVPQHRERIADRGDAGCELRIVDERDEVRVVEQVAQLGLDVAVVDVDRNRAQLVGGEDRLDELHAVEAVDADVVARADTLGVQVVCELVRRVRRAARTSPAGRRRSVPPDRGRRRRSVRSGRRCSRPRPIKGRRAPRPQLEWAFAGARRHLLDYRADGCDLETRIPLPAQRRPRDRRVPRRAPGPARARRPHRSGPGARSPARIRPRDRRGDGRARSRSASPGWCSTPRGSPSRCATTRSTARSRGRSCKLDGADTALLHALDSGSAEAAAPGTRVRIRWADETEGKITDIACFEVERADAAESRLPQASRT